MPGADDAKAHWASPEQVEPRQETVGQMVDRVAAAHPDRDALVVAAPGKQPRRWTYRELVAESKRVARALLARFAPGENVAVWAGNCAEWILLQHGAARAGLRLVTVNPAYLGREASYVLRHSRAVGLFHAPSYRGNDLGQILGEVVAELPDVRAVISLAQWDQFVAAGSPETVLAAVLPSDPVMIQYTSGTTGDPKGVLLSHRGVVNGARLVADRAELEDGVVSINSMPLFHIGGSGTMEFGTLSRGGTYVLAPRFDAAHVLELIETHRATVTLAVPTMLIGLMEHPDRPRRDLSSLRTMMTGGAAVPAELVRRVTTTLGCLFTITFGQTETSGPAIQTSVRDCETDQAETIGRPLPTMEVKITDLDTGDTLGHGEQGEICMRGPLVMLEYFADPEHTTAAVDADGWLHSGDLGTMDDRGFVRITGRSKDMINRGGENIYPHEVENVLFHHEAVSDIVVLGVPDPRWGERVVAVLRLKEDAPRPSEAELRAYAEKRLARYKIPGQWFFVTSFPQTPSGKIQKFVLRDRLVRGSTEFTAAT